ncbi:MAG: hypothetical protein HC767_10195 [Akkermansiaceae bacterium]|nr:hypothetical protein [Akkermansiaceae bacterium]
MHMWDMVTALRQSRAQVLQSHEAAPASLAACKSMTMRMYARQKKWDVGRIAVSVKHDKVHAKDCARRIPVLEPVTDEAAGEPVDKEAELTQDVEETQPPPAAAANTLVKAPRTLHTLTREEAEELETQTKELAKSIRAMEGLTSKDDFLESFWRSIVLSSSKFQGRAAANSLLCSPA